MSDGNKDYPPPPPKKEDNNNKEIQNVGSITAPDCIVFTMND